MTTTIDSGCRKRQLTTTLTSVFFTSVFFVKLSSDKFPSDDRQRRTADLERFYSFLQATTTPVKRRRLLQATSDEDEDDVWKTTTTTTTEIELSTPWLPL